MMNNFYYDRLSGEKTSETGSGQKKGDICIPASALVDFDHKSDLIRSELVHVIVSWLIEQGFTSSAQLLRDEAVALFRQEHNERKALRAMSRAIHEGNWETAYTQLKKLESIVKSSEAAGGETITRATTLLQTLPFLLAQQQFLEYVDEDDGHHAHLFFMRKIKPLEGTISRERFQQLVYMLTCRTVSEAGGIFPAWRGWTPAIGRSQLQSLISKAIGYCHSSPYCSQHVCDVGGEPSVVSSRSLEQILANSLSFELIKLHHPSLLRGLLTHPVHSILRPLSEQLISSNFVASVDVSSLTEEHGERDGVSVRLTACQPFLHVPAVVVGTHKGCVLWVRLKKDEESGSMVSCNTFLTLYQYNTPVRGMTSHDNQILLSWSGCQAVILNLGQFIGKVADVSESLVDCVANTFSHAAEVYSSCLFPCGSILAVGLSEGTVTIWDMSTGAKMFQHSFSTFAIESLVANRSGSCYFAASKEGIVRVVDITTGVLLFTFASPVSSEVVSMALSPSASLLLVSYREDTLRFWDVLTGELLPQRLDDAESNTRKCVSVVFGSVDSHIISGHDDGVLCLWDLGRSWTKEKPFLFDTPQSASNGAQEKIPQENAAGGAFLTSISGRYYWPAGGSVPAPVRIRLHRSKITDVKFQHNYAVSCGDDGVVCICSSVL